MLNNKLDDILKLLLSKEPKDKISEKVISTSEPLEEKIKKPKKDDQKGLKKTLASSKKVDKKPVKKKVDKKPAKKKTLKKKK
jgi:hypothetical protein